MSLPDALMLPWMTALFSVHVWLASRSRATPGPKVAPAYSVGVPPNQASPADQDHLALVLYRWLGKSPWGGAC